MPPKKAKNDFAGKFEELEQIAEWFEKGEPDIEEGMKRVKRASELAEELKTVLDKAENSIRVIREKQED